MSERFGQTAEDGHDWSDMDDMDSFHDEDWNPGEFELDAYGQSVQDGLESSYADNHVGERTVNWLKGKGYQYDFETMIDDAFGDMDEDESDLDYTEEDEEPDVFIRFDGKEVDKSEDNAKQYYKLDD